MISNDGVGFDVDAAWGRGLGLVSMSERLEAVGGMPSSEAYAHEIVEPLQTAEDRVVG